MFITVQLEELRVECLELRVSLELKVDPLSSSRT